MKGKRIVSLLLCLVLTLGLLPMSVFAYTPPTDTEAHFIDLSYAQHRYKISVKAVDAQGTSVGNSGKVEYTYYATSGKPKEPTIKLSTKTSSIPTSGTISPLSGLTLQASDKPGDLEAYVFPVTLKITPNDGYEITGISFKRKNKGEKTENPITLKNESDHKNDDGSWTVNFTPKSEDGFTLATKSSEYPTLYVYITMKTTGPTTHQVTYVPRPEDSPSATIVKDTADKATAPTQNELSATFKDDAYFSIMEPVAWYTEAPKNANGVYTYDESRKWNFDTEVTGNLSLYAKNELKKDATLTVSYNLCVQDRSVSAAAFGADTLYYNPKTKKVSKDISAAVVQIPIGKELTADDLAATGAYADLLAGETEERKTALIPTRGARVSGWWYENKDRVWTELKAGATISKEEALYRVMNSIASARRINVVPEADLDLTATFHPKAVGVTIDAWENTYHYSQKASSPILSIRLPEQKRTEIEQTIAAQGEKDKTQLFRGWYLSSDFSDGSKVDLTKYDFRSDTDLYAKWVPARTLRYDFGKYTPSNSSKFADRTVGDGDRLEKPATPVGIGFAFKGWFKDETFKTLWNFDTDMIARDTVLYAKIEPSRQITVNFKYVKPDDLTTMQVQSTAENTPVASGYQFGSLPDLPGEKKTTKVFDNTIFDYVTVTTFTSSGKKRTLTYTGWAFTDEKGKQQPLTETTVLADHLAANAKSLDVFATYDVSFTIKFDLDDGKMTNRPADKVIKGERGTVDEPTEKPTKENWAFGGWINAATNADFVFTNPCTENTIIKAKWVTPKQYTVMFQLEPATASFTITKQNDDTVIPPESSENGKVTYKLTSGAYTWTASAEGYKTIKQNLTVAEDYDETHVNPIKLTPFQAVTKIELNIPNNQIMQKKSYDLSSLATVAPEDASYKNITWSVSGDGVTLGEDGKTLTVSDTADGTVTLTAAITNGKLNEAGTTEVEYTKPFTLTIVPYQPTISFNAGTGPAEKDITGMPAPVLAVDSKISAPTAPKASGWTFDGWYLDTACTIEWAADHTFTADTTLYAKWTKNPVAVTITFAGGEDAVLNTGASGELKGMSGDKITRPACMYTKSGYIFRSWDGTFAGTEYTLEEAKTFTAQWTQITSAIVADDINHALDGISADNAKDYKPQLLAARDALAAGTATKTDAALIGTLSALFKSAGLGSVTISGDANQNAAETGAILSSDGSAVVLNINKQTTAGKALPTAYQNEEYKSAWRTISMTVGGATTDPKVPVILSLPIPTELSGMAADTIRVLAYKGAATEPVVLTPTVSDGKLTFGFDGNGTFAFVGKEISDAADTRVTALVMKYNGTKMGNVEQDASGNFTVTLPSTTSESVLQDLSSGINSKWLTYLTVAPQAKVKPSDGADQTAEYWANTGLALTYSLSSSNSYSQTRSFTVTAANGTTRTFTVTVKKITDADRNYKIAVSNINGGTVTATPSPAAAGEEVKLTVTPNDGKKLVAGSLSYCLQSAGAKSVPIDESSLTFIMLAGDININAQFEDDANAPLKNPPQITAFVVNGVSAVINSDTKAITIILPYGTDLRHVAPTIVTANASKVKPSSAQRVDLSTPKAYRVYASNGAYVTYTVTAYTEEPSPTQSLWEKLQNQINSSPNWWELAEYQKKAGYYR